MNPITVTVTGRLGDDPRSFTTHDGTAGVELRLAIDLPSRTGGESITRWVKVSAYGLLASRTAESVRKGDRVTVIAEDLLAEAWLSTDNEAPAPRPGDPARPRDRRLHGLRHPAHRLRRPQSRPAGSRQRPADRPARRRAGRRPRPRRRHHQLLTPPGGAGSGPLPH